MKPIEEQVQLPDPQSQFLVHPMDVPEARADYVRGWWLGTLATPQVFVAILAVLWVVSNNYVTPVLVPLVLVAASGWLGSRFTRSSWEYIPRKRHDTGRRFPKLALGRAVATSTALLVGLVVAIMWAAGQDFVQGFSAYPLGTGVAIAAIMAGELVLKLVRRHTTVELIPDAISLAVVAVAVWLGFVFLPEGGEVIRPVDLIPGAAILIGIWLAWLVFTRWQFRRDHDAAMDAAS